MKLIKQILIIGLLVNFLLSCNKSKDASAENGSDDKSSSSIPKVASFNGSQSEYTKYVAIISSYTMNPIDRANSYVTQAKAKIMVNGATVNAGPLSIGGVTVNPGTYNLYNYTYSLTQGKALFGTSVSCSVDDSSRILSKHTSAVIVMPKELYPSSVTLPGTIIDRQSNYTLNWAPDPSNQYGKVIINMLYYRDISQNNAPGMPASIASLVYTVADNGTFTIPQADLARFPSQSYVGLSIARGWLDNTTSDVAYVGIVEAHSTPILIYETPPPATPTINDQSTFYFSASVTYGSGKIKAKAGTVVTVNVSSGGPNGPYTTNMSITGATFASGGNSLQATGYNGGSVSSTFVMPAAGYVTWSGSFSEPNSYGSGGISVK